ncbi:hypothetical protein GCM10017786_03320 [Amycolatopsis deserti]|uniref:Uncharacterized protein n=1 Tax=Amycolatopsis deserti TaxID=185696 RepID=A0ABQ3IEM5_9PSEU|nr:hypothetical protein GCM10017786_03320 [Amycolatopsis deserti]
MHESRAIEDGQVFGDRLARDREMVAQAGRRAGAVREQQVEQAAPDRVADRRPEFVVDGHRHRATTVGA